MAVILGRKGGGSGGGGAPSGPAGGVLSGTYPNPGLELNAKGDLIVASAADTAALLPVGATNGMVLEVASAQAAGVQWDTPPGFELDYAQKTTNTTISGSSGTPTDVLTGAGFTADGSTIVLVEFFAPDCTAGSASMIVEFYLDGSSVARICSLSASSTQPGYGAYRVTPAAGTRTFAVKAWKNGGTDGAINAGSPAGSGTNVPTFIRVTKV